MDPKAMNEDFAQKIVAGAMAAVDAKVAAEGRGFGSEIWYSIEIPYDEGTEEAAYFGAMLDGGSIKDPNYLDLFERVIKGMKAGLDKTALRSFTTVNCRFDANLPDNFMLYVFLS